MNWLLKAGRNWGWMFTGALAAFAIAYAVLNPVQQAADHVAAPVARSVGIIEGQCPNGWDFNSFADHAAQQTCTKGSIAVTLTPYTKFANYGIDTKGGADAPMIIPCSRIPGWPSDWCAPE